MTTDLIPIRVQAPAIPEPTSNLDEVQANIDALLAAYTDRVYTAEDIKGAKADRASAFVTPEGRLDTELLQTFAQPQEEPPRRRYRFWVEFTPEDVAWFKAAAAERGFRFGSIK